MDYSQTSLIRSYRDNLENSIQRGFWIIEVRITEVLRVEIQIVEVFHFLNENLRN